MIILGAFQKFLSVKESVSKVRTYITVRKSVRIVGSVVVQVSVCRSIVNMAAKHPEDAELPFSFMEEDSEEEGVYDDPDLQTALFEDALAADDGVVIGANPMIGGGDERRVERRESSPIRKIEAVDGVEQKQMGDWHHCLVATEKEFGVTTWCPKDEVANVIEWNRQTDERLTWRQLRNWRARGVAMDTTKKGIRQIATWYKRNRVREYPITNPIRVNLSPFTRNYQYDNHININQEHMKGLRKLVHGPTAGTDLDRRCEWLLHDMGIKKFGPRQKGVEFYDVPDEGWEPMTIEEEMWEHDKGKKRCKMNLKINLSSFTENFHELKFINERKDARKKESAKFKYIIKGPGEFARRYKHLDQSMCGSLNSTIDSLDSTFDGRAEPEEVEVGGLKPKASSKSGDARYRSGFNASPEDPDVQILKEVKKPEVEEDKKTRRERQNKERSERRKRALKKKKDGDADEKLEEIRKAEMKKKKKKKKMKKKKKNT